MSTPADLLEPLTSPSTTTPNAVTAAVDGLRAQAQAAAPDQSALASLTWNAFNALLDAAGRTPHEHQAALVEFVVRLQQTTATDAEGKPLRCDGTSGGEAGELWGDLPTFGWVARESLNFDPYDPEATQDERAEWENQAAFMAQLTGLVTRIDMSLYGLWMLRDAFEDVEGRTGFSRTAVRIAALWVRYAGERLRKMAAEEVAYPERLGSSRGKYREREWVGFNEERWEVWREGLKAAREQFGDDDVIKAAVEVMEKL